MNSGRSWTALTAPSYQSIIAAMRTGSLMYQVNRNTKPKLGMPVRIIALNIGVSHSRSIRYCQRVGAGSTAL